MRVLEIDPNAATHTNANFVWGVMMFPDDRERAFEHFARAELLSLGLWSGPNEKPITLPTGWVKALVLGDSLPDIEKKTAVARRQGLTAGMLLTFAHMYGQTGEPVTLNGVIDAIVLAHENKSLPPAWNAYKNKPEIFIAWKAMASVAHLWASTLAIQNGISMGTEQPSPTTFLKNLAFASAFLRWGAGCIVPGERGTTRPLLDTSTAWTLPPEFDGPDLPSDWGELPPEIRTAAFGKRTR